MEILIKLILSHVLGDFVFQPNSWVQEKKQKRFKAPTFYFHILIHGFLTWMVLGFPIDQLWVVPIVVISHGVIDMIKIGLDDKWPNGRLFLLDQFAHFVVLFIVSYSIDPLAFVHLWQTVSPYVIPVVLAVVLLSSVMSVVLKVVLSKWSSQIQMEQGKESSALAQAGKYIGILERTLIFVFILLNQWSAIGFLIAAKSIFRFSDLSRSKDRMLTEYMLIGTLISFGSAILIGIAFKSLTPMFMAL